MVTRRSFLKTTGLAGAGLVLGPTLLGTERKASAAGGGTVYKFVNKTNGKWKDEQIFWSLDERTWHSWAKEPTVPCPNKNGRVYFYVDKQPANFDDRSTYWDFIEWAHNGGKWAGNTTQVDAWSLPITIEMGNKKVGIVGPRTKLFEKFKKEAPAAFKNCVIGDFWIVSPFKADMGRGKPFANYYEKYVDEVWEMYAKETKTPSGKYVGKADPNGALTFTPTAGGGKPHTCDKKPTTSEILLGEGTLQRNADFCGAFNRHVAEDPALWRDPTKYYLKEPCNWYSRFFHECGIDHKAYGFCYDDAAEQAAYFGAEGNELIVTLYWD
jgi:hypothetical protein